MHGFLHKYSRHVAYEFGTANFENVVVFIGGLGNGLLDVPYVAPLALELHYHQWGVVQALIESSHSGWGQGSLERDARQLAELVEYLRLNGKKKVVLMGHSTGCQDTMEYLTKLAKTPELELNGAILQAPVSDAEAIGPLFNPKDLKRELAYAKALIDANKGDTLMGDNVKQKLFNTPVTAYRFHSLLAPRGDDDYFSSYLTQEDYASTFGVVATPLLVLYGGKDEFVPLWVDGQALIERWRDATNPLYWSDLSRVVPGATHDVGEGSDEGAQIEVITVVTHFLLSLL